MLTSCNKQNNFFEVYKDFYSAFPSDVIKTKDGGFIIAGWGRSSNYHNSSNGIAIKLNSEGEREWAREYGNNNSYEKFKFAVSLDNDEYYLGGNKDNNIWITKIDSKGEVLLEKTFGGSFFESGEDACYDSNDKSLFIVGTTNKSGNGDIIILKIDNTGKVLTKKIYTDDRYENVFSCMFDKKDSSLILTGSKFTSDRNGLDAFIMKVNNYGSPIWEKSFGGEGGEVFWDSEIDNEGNYLFSGTSTLSESGTSAIIIKFDKLGRLINTNIFNDFPHSSGKNLIKKSNNTFTIIGRSGNFSGHKNNKLLILNLNKNINLDSHKIVSKTLGIEGKIGIELNEVKLLVSGTTNRGNIFTLTIIN